jgi:pimeloyl-ACP methyl ester carboxylesterase
VIIVLSILAVAYLGGCYWLAIRYLNPDRIIVDAPAGTVDTDWDLGTPEPIPVWSTPGIAAGRPQSSTVFVLVHGFRGCRAAWLDTIEDLTSKGYEVVVPAMPAHDASPEKLPGFGTLESKRLVSLASEVRSRYKGAPCRLIGVGVSMGGSALWLASEASPTAFDAIVSDCAFSDFEEAIGGWFDASMPGGRYVLAPVQFFATRMSGIHPRTIQPLASAKKWRGRPSLIIQGERDQIMSRRQAERLSEAAQCEVYWIPEAGHAQCYQVARTEYLKRLVNLAEILELSSKDSALDKTESTMLTTRGRKL